MRIMDAIELSGFARKTAESAGVVSNLIKDVRDSYRPKLLDMRGPGPRWRARHRPRLGFDSEDSSSNGASGRSVAKGEDKMIEWFDDLALGMHFKTGELSVTKEDILRFAAEFDPQPFHLDEVAAEKSIFKGLAASGWHTLAISMRLCVDCRPFGSQPILGLGVNDLRWMAPVRPGDVLHVEGDVVELTPSRTKPQGIVKIKWTTYNQRGEAVSAFVPIIVLARNPDPAILPSA